MATAPSQHPVTILPPGPINHALHFDLEMGRKPAYAVGIRFAAHGEVDSTGLDWADACRMGYVGRKLNAGRCGETPRWALNDDSLRKVLVRYVEKRAGFKKVQPGSEAQRLQRSQEKLIARRVSAENVLTNLAREYAALKVSDADYGGRLRELAIEIENLDTTILVNEKMAGLALRVVHLYYRQGLDSPQVAHEVGLKPPHIRQILSRLRNVAASLGFHSTIQRSWKGGRRRAESVLAPKAAEPQAPRAQKLCAKCGAACPKGSRLNCSRECWPSQPAKPQKNYMRHWQAEIPAPVRLGRRSRYEEIIRAETFRCAVAKSIAAYPHRTQCSAGHDLVNPEAGHIHVGDLMRTGRRTCRTCWKADQAAYVKRLTSG